MGNFATFMLSVMLRDVSYDVPVAVFSDTSSRRSPVRGDVKVQLAAGVCVVRLYQQCHLHFRKLCHDRSGRSAAHCCFRFGFYSATVSSLRLLPKDGSPTGL